MQSDTRSNATHSWWKGILIGFLSWLAAFALYMLPSLVVGISMGVDLGPKLNDNVEVSRRISQTISAMYQSGWYLHIGFIVVLGCIVFWRASVGARHLAENSVRHGITIGVTAALLVILQMILFGVGIYMIIGVVVCVAAGVAGGRQRRVSRKAE
jgi:hypothetical protein